METKHCNGCNQDKPLNEFYFNRSGRKAGTPKMPCKACADEYQRTHPRSEESKQRARDRAKAWALAYPERKRLSDQTYHKAHFKESQEYRMANKEHIRQRDNEWRYRTCRSKPLKDSKELPTYLGVYIAERVLSNYFEDIQRMPYGNKGYDYVCKRGFKIDVKSSVLHHRENRIPRWVFPTRHNTTADHFLCLAFDNRESLNPVHIWLVPSKDVAIKPSISVGDCDKSLSLWSKYAKPIDKVISSCNALRGDITI